MRENIGLFRGKRIDNGEWVEGNLHTSRYKADDFRISFYPVDPDTVGECTGLKANGKLIFEGDIVEGYDYNADDGYGVVKNYDGAFEITNGEWTGTFYESYYGWEFEIIGTIYD